MDVVLPPGIARLVERVAAVEGIVAVVLGGSRAAGTAGPGSDWDLGLYYEGHLDVAALRALDPRCTVPYAWGSIVNGGAWLEVDGIEVDLIYREVAEVERWTAAAHRGELELRREVGYVAGIPTYLLAAELDTAVPLLGTPPPPPGGVPAALRASAPPLWRQLARGATSVAAVAAERAEPVTLHANLALAVLCEAHARTIEAGRWHLNEKRLVADAGLAHLGPAVAAGDVASVAAVTGTW